MGKKLAIQGHTTRGKEVIELFKMMGGCECGYCGGGTGFYYYISQFGNIEGSSEPYEFDTYIVYTLEEFLEVYPFKVGDKVMDRYGNSLTIKSMSWSEDCETMVYDFKDSVIVLAAEDLYAVNDMGLKIEKNTNMNIEFDLTKYSYEIKDEKLVISEKKPKYPTTYDECCEMLNANEFVEYELMVNFPKLINARNAYWKIAGEQMGLGKPWKPDWTNEEQYKYCIYYADGNIQKGIWFIDSSILAFPTVEMRDIFYENFKELIEQCKELL